MSFTPAGALILRVVLPEAGTSLYAVDTLVRGAGR